MALPGYLIRRKDLRAEHLRRGEVVFDVYVPMVNGVKTVAVDATGVTSVKGTRFVLDSEVAGFLDEVRMQAAVSSSVSDFTLRIELVRASDGAVVAYMEFSGPGRARCGA